MSANVAVRATDVSTDDRALPKADGADWREMARVESLAIQSARISSTLESARKGLSTVRCVAPVGACGGCERQADFGAL